MLSDVTFRYQEDGQTVVVEVISSLAQKKQDFTIARVQADTARARAQAELGLAPYENGGITFLSAGKDKNGYMRPRINCRPERRDADQKLMRDHAARATSSPIRSSMRDRRPALANAPVPLESYGSLHAATARVYLHASGGLCRQ